MSVRPPEADVDQGDGFVSFVPKADTLIEVSDTGPGVPPELAERIFEPFFTTRESSGGTGLGLWLAREIVEEEGGTIELCRGPLAGATFLVSLASG